MKLSNLVYAILFAIAFSAIIALTVTVSNSYPAITYYDSLTQEEITLVFKDRSEAYAVKVKLDSQKRWNVFEPHFKLKVDKVIQYKVIEE